MIRTWLKAARLPSQSYIALPLLLGQVLAWAATDTWSWTVFALVQLFGITDQLYIVWANDYADRDTDAQNNTFTIFSGGSRVLVDQSLSPKTLLRAAQAMVLLSVILLATLAYLVNPLIFPIGVTGLILLWAYSFKPLMLSYRGGGELLQTLGVGLVLPLIGYMAQGGDLFGFPWDYLAILLPLNLATAIATALPDVPSDSASNKRTIPVKFGLEMAIWLIVGLVIAASALHVWLLGERTSVTVPIACAFIISAVAFKQPKPGDFQLSTVVFFSILANLGYVGTLIAFTWI